MLQKKKETDGVLTRFTDERTAKILWLNITGKCELDFAQFACVYTCQFKTTLWGAMSKATQYRILHHFFG